MTTFCSVFYFVHIVQRLIFFNHKEHKERKHREHRGYSVLYVLNFCGLRGFKKNQQN